MTLPVVLACFWVLAATIVAFLPMRYQILPGLVLLVAAPVMIVWLAMATNVWIGLAAFAGFLSMFRNPLRYLIKKAMGKKTPTKEREPE
ncbi:DUF2484 family protein [Defluviimonas sp. SAOS-178_SWC]|uniref:DUF2484 family protein n=1 Tax=Defluviimonas sp. SAOS-178_SWC TaxID=3121287 RepID=UPI003221A8D0